MKQLLFGIFLFLTVFQSNSQTDTTVYDTTQYKKYDYVYLKEGGVRRGKITSFDSNTGLIVLEDEYGRTFSLTPMQYDYYKRDVLVPVKKRRKKRDLLPRKEDEFEFTVGLTPMWRNVNVNFTPDEYFINGNTGAAFVPVCLTIGAGKYFGRQHYVGVTGNLQMLTLSGGNYFDFGARYAFQYDRNETNTSLYLPVELKFHNYSDNYRFQANDTIFDPQGGFSTPVDYDLDLSMRSIGLKIGHGFGFMLSGKKSFALELFLARDFVLSQRFAAVNGRTPDTDLGVVSFGFSFRFNF